MDILMVEDNPGDVRLAREALKDSPIPNEITVVRDGEEALSFLRQEGSYASALRPDLIVLDLNLPKKDGREVLGEIKSDDRLKRIPVAILTTSNASQDLTRAYDLHANCYVIKPVGLEEYMSAVRSIQSFWASVVKLPPRD
jgi:chemotaxis family two-component system response regulator Rcp1